MTKLAIFNLDDTLCDFNLGLTRARTRIALILREAQIPEAPFWNTFLQIEPEFQNAMVNGFLDSGTYLWRTFFETCSQFTGCVGVLPDALTRIFREETVQKVKLLDDVEETLSSLQKAGIRVAIYARGDSASQREKFHNLGLHKILTPQSLFVSEELSAPLLSESAFSQILSITHTTSDNTVLISDSEKDDVAAAKSMGIRTVLVKRNHHAHHTHHEHEGEYLNALRELNTALGIPSSTEPDYQGENTLLSLSHITIRSENPWRTMYWE
jgi:FMN phosphatase YigB (HAD superfamily)